MTKRLWLPLGRGVRGNRNRNQNRNRNRNQNFSMTKRLWLPLGRGVGSNYRLQPTSHIRHPTLHTTNYRLPTTDYRLPTTDYQLIKLPSKIPLPLKPIPFISIFTPHDPSGKKSYQVSSAF